MFNNKSRFIMKNTFLVMFYYLIKQRILQILRLKKHNFNWFYDLSNLIILKIVQNKLSNNIENKFKNLVLSGPFKNLKIDNNIFVPSQILGMFENELHKLLTNKILKKKYQNLINVGVANGYYLLGLMKFGNFLKGYAIDIDTKHFAKIKELIINNNIIPDVVFLDNFNKLNSYSQNLKNSLVVCDIEGDEIDIINIKKYPWLKNNDILVEVHGEEIVRKITNQFESSHTVTKIHNSAVINYKFPSEINNYKIFNLIDKLYLSGSLRILETPWLFLEIKTK